MNLESLGKLLLLMGAVLVLSDLAVTLWGRTGLAEKLPGDILIRREALPLYFPVATFIGLSLALTIVVNIVLRFLR